MAEIIEAKHTSESGHWYHQDGTPAYTVMGKNGKERNTTLRDARKENLVPSVTGIINMAAKPGLDNWKIDQNIMAALTIPRIAGESNENFIARIKADAKEQALKAREKGTLIHAMIQGYFEGKIIPNEYLPYCYSADGELQSKCNNKTWTCEMSFAIDGYGGKVDLHNPQFVIDIKTSQKTVSDAKIWTEHLQQLAAYRFGLLGESPTAKCGILFVNTDNAESRLVWAEEADLVKGLRCFNALKDYYYALTGL